MLHMILPAVFIFLLFGIWALRPWAIHRRTLNFAETYTLLENFVDKYLTQYMHEKTGYDTILSTTILHPKDYEKIIIETTKYIVENMPSFVTDEASRYMTDDQINSVIFIKVSNWLSSVYEIDSAGATEQMEVTDGDAH